MNSRLIARSMCVATMLCMALAVKAKAGEPAFHCMWYNLPSEAAQKKECEEITGNPSGSYPVNPRAKREVEAGIASRPEPVITREDRWNSEIRSAEIEYDAARIRYSACTYSSLAC